MEAKEFVKQYGWDEARKCIPYCSKRGDFIYYKNIGINFNNLKTLVYAWELVEKFGGLFHAKVTLEKEGFTGGIELDDELIEDVVLKQAIKLVEQCQ